MDLVMKVGSTFCIPRRKAEMVGESGWRPSNLCLLRKLFLLLGQLAFLLRIGACLGLAA